MSLKRKIPAGIILAVGLFLFGVSISLPGFTQQTPPPLRPKNYPNFPETSISDH